MKYHRWIVLTFQGDGSLHQPTEIPIVDTEKQAVAWAKARLEQYHQVEYSYVERDVEIEMDSGSLRLTLDGVVELQMEAVEAVDDTGAY